MLGSKDNMATFILTTESVGQRRWKTDSKGALNIYLDMGLPEAARGEKDTSNNSSIPAIFCTKYLNLRWNMLTPCCSTSW